MGVVVGYDEDVVFFDGCVGYVELFVCVVVFVSVE